MHGEYCRIVVSNDNGFFFKQRRAYEMRISDWSSDVGSSDLFMPPVMCAGVFILATLTETSYLTIALMNVIPACLFFFFLLSMVDLEAVRLGLKGMPTEDIPSVRRVLAEGWHFILPLGVIIEIGRAHV